jgi:hypothetical protein
MPDFYMPQVPNAPSIDLMGAAKALGQLPEIFQTTALNQSKLDVINQLKGLSLTDAQGNVNPAALATLATTIAPLDPKGAVDAALGAQQLQYDIQGRKTLGGDTGGPPPAAPGAAAQPNYSAVNQPTQYDDRYTAKEREHNLPPGTLKAMGFIESRHDPRAWTRGSRYKGLMQIGPDEAAKYGCNVWDADSSIECAAKIASANQFHFRQVMRREPNASELYLMHQQGAGGGPALIANPDIPAWQALNKVGVPRDLAIRSIRGNGGDPFAPASKFVQKWAGYFGPSAGTAGGQSALAAAPIASQPAATAARPAGVTPTITQIVADRVPDAASRERITDEIATTLGKNPDDEATPADRNRITGLLNTKYAERTDVATDQPPSAVPPTAVSPTPVPPAPTPTEPLAQPAQVAQAPAAAPAAAAGPVARRAPTAVSVDLSGYDRELQALTPPNWKGTALQFRDKLARDMIGMSAQAAAPLHDRIRRIDDVLAKRAEAEIRAAEPTAKEKEAAHLNMTVPEYDRYMEQQKIDIQAAAPTELKRQARDAGFGDDVMAYRGALERQKADIEATIPTVDMKNAKAAGFDSPADLQRHLEEQKAAIEAKLAKQKADIEEAMLTPEERQAKREGTGLSEFRLKQEQQKAEIATEQDIKKAEFKRYQAVEEGISAAGGIAVSDLQDAQLAKSLTNHPDFTSGNLVDQKLFLKRAVPEVFGAAEPMELYQKIVYQRLLNNFGQMRAVTKEMGDATSAGRIFSQQVTQGEKAVGMLQGTSPAGLRGLAELSIRTDQRFIQLADFMTAYKAGDKDRLPVEFTKTWPPKKPGRLDDNFDKGMRDWQINHPYLTEQEIADPKLLGARTFAGPLEAARAGVSPTEPIRTADGRIKYLPAIKSYNSMADVKAAGVKPGTIVRVLGQATYAE